MKIVRNNILCKNITFIDGLSGSGKSLIAPFISSLSSSELWKISHLYEYIFILLDLKKINFDAACTLLKIQADVDLYNLSISRDVNFRRDDDSSPYYNLLDEKYLKRLKLKGGDKITENILHDNPSLILMTHFIAQKVPLIEQIFNDINWKLIVVLRNPIVIIKKWYESGIFERHNNDPREFTITENTEGIVHPWYARKDKLMVYSSIEHITDFVINYFLDQDKIHAKYNKNYIKIYFEVFKVNPHKYISQLESIYGQSSDITKKLLTKFELPSESKKLDEDSQNNKDLLYILGLMEDKSLKKNLTELCKKYELESK